MTISELIFRLDHFHQEHHVTLSWDFVLYDLELCDVNPSWWESASDRLEVCFLDDDLKPTDRVFYLEQGEDISCFYDQLVEAA